MRVLSVDSNAETGAVGIFEDGKVLAYYTLEAKTHSTTLLPMIESVLSTSGLAVTDMDLLAVSNGPGSFTGIRIGVATVKGLAFRDNIPCIGVSALEAMAYNLAGLDGIFCPVINARRNQVYTALFLSDNGEITRLSEDAILPISELIPMLDRYDGTVYFTGDAAGTVYSAVDRVDKAQPPLILRRPNAYGVAALGEKLYREAADPSVFTEEALAPAYLRKSQPEREREARLQQQSTTGYQALD